VSALHIVTVTLRLAVAAEDASAAEEAVLATLEGLGVPAACPSTLAPDLTAHARPATLSELRGMGAADAAPWLVDDGELTEYGDDQRSCADWVTP
jgi:hypothetical protein